MVSALFFAGVTEPATLEPLACRDALALAEDLALVKVNLCCICDCSPAVSEIREGRVGEYGSIVSDIRSRAEYGCHEGR
jgi:hypothetical protein